MKMNAEKCCSFISDNKFEQMWARIRDSMIWENRTVELFEIMIGNELIICIKANRKLTVLTKWENVWISVRWDFCLSPILNPSSNTVLSGRCFIVEKLIIWSINLIKWLFG